jgi:hypothetical protein
MFNCELTQAQQVTSDKIDQGIATHGSFKAWLKWERENNPNFREEVFTKSPQKQTV